VRCWSLPLWRFTIGSSSKILLLREDFASTPEYKRICRKKAVDDWKLAIDTLVAWTVFPPEAAVGFRKLADMRNKAIHFRLETDTNDRHLALEAIRSLQRITATQFSAFGSQPWFLTTAMPEIHIRKDWENVPFVTRVYLPRTSAVIIGSGTAGPGKMRNLWDGRSS